MELKDYCPQTRSIATSSAMLSPNRISRLTFDGGGMRILIGGEHGIPAATSILTRPVRPGQTQLTPA